MSLVHIYYVHKFHEEIISEKLENIASKLEKSGYSDAASILSSIFDIAVQSSD